MEIKNFFRRLLSFNDIGIDLGTANTLVYKSGKGIILREPSVVALDNQTKKPVAVGNEAKNMIGRKPDSIIAIRPLKEGVIADFESSATMLKYFIKKSLGKMVFSKVRILICIPYGVTDVEKRAVSEAAKQTGAKDVKIIEEPLAAAIGAGCPVSEPTGSMVIDIGGGTSEIAVISLGGIVVSKSVRTAGDALDNAIIAYIKKQFNLFIGERTAEEIKIAIGNTFDDGKTETMQVRGRDLVTGLPKNITVTSDDIRASISEPISVIMDAIKATLEETPPELASDIIDHGIMLTGGGALLKGLDKLIYQETLIPVHIAESPLDCVAVGTGKSLENSLIWNSISE